MIYNRLKEIGKLQGSRTAIIRNNEAMSYTDLIAKVDLLANVIIGQSEAKESPTIGLLSNSPELITIAILCADKLGAMIFTGSIDVETDIVLYEGDNIYFESGGNKCLINLLEIFNKSQSSSVSDKRVGCLPEGIETTSKNYLNYIDWFIEDLNTDSAKWVVEYYPGSFNELRFVIPLLLGGGTIYLIDNDIEQISKLRKVSYNYLQCSADTLTQILKKDVTDVLPENIVITSDFRLDNLPGLMSEVIGAHLAVKFLHYIHGFVECTFACSYQRISREDFNAARSGNIGLPVRKCGLLILDQHQQIVTGGLTGNLYIAGSCVNLKSDSSRLVTDPFGGGELKMFDTRLRARYRNDGSVHVVKERANDLINDGRLYPIDTIEEKILSLDHIKSCKITEIKGRWVCLVETEDQVFMWKARLLQYLTDSPLQSLLNGMDVIQLPEIPTTEDGNFDGETLSGMLDLDVALHIGQIEDKFPGRLLLQVNEKNKYSSKGTRPVSDKLIETTQPALSQAPSLQQPEFRFENVGAYLQNSAEYYPSHGIVLNDGKKESFISYPQLLLKAKAVATGLAEKNLNPGDRVILQMQDQIDFFPVFWGCILRGVVPLVLGVPPVYDKSQGLARKINNAWTIMEKPVIICSSSLIQGVEGLRDEFEMQDLDVVKYENLIAIEIDEQAMYKSQSNDLIFFLMTSGSTGLPKCIKVSHKGALSHIFGIKDHMGLNDEDVVVNMLPIDHITPLLSLHTRAVVLGANQVHIDISAFLNDPLIWFDTIEKHSGTHTFSPNFAYKLVSEKLATTSSNKTWNLGSIKSFKNGGELISNSVVDEFFTLTKSYGTQVSTFQPAYGMTEVAGAVTLCIDYNIDVNMFHIKTNAHQQVIVSAPQDDESLTFIDVGRPINGTSIRIANVDNELLNEYEIGSVQLKGDVVTSGYLNNPEAEKEVFLPDGWFKTGDLGFIADGRLIITGREKDLLIYNGVNYYAYEIEYVLNNLEGVESNYTAAVSYSEKSNSEGIAVFFTPKKEIIKSTGKLITQIKAELSRQLGIEPSIIVPLNNEDFPRTDSGKIDKPSLRKRLVTKEFGALFEQLGLSHEDKRFTVYTTDQHVLREFHDHFSQKVQIKIGDILPNSENELKALDYRLVNINAPQLANDPLIKKIVDIWSEILQSNSITLDSSFFELGGNSLKAIQIVTRINESLGIDVTLKELFNNPSIVSLSKCLQNKAPQLRKLIEPREEADHYELSHAQKLLWILDEQEDNHVAYNMFQAYRFNGKLDLDAFKKTFDLLIEKHESLRTIFIKIKGEPRQRILSDIPFKINYSEYNDHEALNIDELIKQEVVSPFDLSTGPLLRGKLIKIGDQDYIFLFSMHHIISDGWSFEVIISDIMNLYHKICTGQPNKEELPIQFKDYCKWYNQLLSHDSINVHRNYWKQKLTPEVTPLNLIDSKPRPVVKSYDGKVISSILGSHRSNKILLFSKDKEVTSFHFFVSIIKVLLFKYTKQKDITLGAPIAGRLNSQLENQIGLYLNNVVLRDNISNELSFDYFMNEVRNTILEAYTHDIYPFDNLIEDLNIIPQQGRNPIYDMMVVMDTNGTYSAGANTGEIEAKSFVDVETIEPEYPISKLDLTFFVRKVNDSFELDLEFRTDLYADDLINTMVRDINLLIDVVLLKPTIKVQDLLQSTYTPTEKNEIEQFKGSVVEQLSNDF